MTDEQVLVGVVEAVMILEPQAEIVSTRIDSVEVSGGGFEGDRHAGVTRPATGRDKEVPRGTPLKNMRQVSLVAAEELEQVSKELEVEEVRPEWLGANLALSGIPGLTKLPEGSRLRFQGGVELIVSGENMPCTSPGRELQARNPKMEGLQSRFPKAAMGRRGLVAWVKTPGRISTGDRVEALVDQPD